MTPGAFLQVHLDDSNVGGGWRCMLVLSVGRKWTRLFYPPTCDVVRIPNAVASTVRTEPVKIRKGKLVARIRANAGDRKTDAIAEALAMVRAA